MSASEIKQLRTEGRLEEALALAIKEYDDAIANLPVVDGDDGLIKAHSISNQARLLWPKRNLSWVYYELLKQNNTPEQFNIFLSDINKIKDLELPEDERMLFDQLSWQIGKMTFALLKQMPVNKEKINALYEAIGTFHFTKPSESYSYLVKAFHKAYKDTDKYVGFIDWWQLNYLRPEDFQPGKMTDGSEIMSIGEQIYTAYAKKLSEGELVSSGPFIVQQRKVDAEMIQQFLPSLNSVIDSHPSFIYLQYFKAKLLLVLGDKEHTLSALLPFVRKKRNDFWAWEVLAEAFSGEKDKVFSCLCRGLLCKSPDEMLITIRQKMATLLIDRKLFAEARTEIESLVKARTAKGYRIPQEVINWQNQPWYSSACPSNNNYQLYKKYADDAEALLYGDMPTENVIVDFVNKEKKILNFIASNIKFGFFKYDRFLDDVTIGDTLKVRFNGNGSENGLYQVYTVEKTRDDSLSKKYLKEVTGKVELPDDRPFGIVNHVFIHPAIVNRFNLKNNQEIKARAISSYQSDKKQWSWKIFEITE